MASIFSRIVSGELPCHKVYEDENHLAFLDINPLVLGHTLVIPKKEIDYLFAIDTNEYLQLMNVVKIVAEKIKKSISCNRVGVSVIGLEVPHAHVHLIPINTMDDMNFARPKLKPSTEQLANIATIIRSA
jgi:histidine triad (HIT) family protein